MPQIDWTLVYDTLSTYGLHILYAVLVLLIGLRLIKWLIRIVKRHLEKSKLESSLKTFLLPLIGLTLRVALIISVIGILGIQDTPFVALLGSFGLAVGLALQGGLSNFAGGVLILLMKTYRVGDYIQSGNFSGTVKEIHIFYTTLVTPDNKKIIIPNANLSNSALTNYSSYPTRRIDWSISCGYENDIALVKSVLENLIRSHELVLKEPVPAVYLNNYGNSSIDFIIRAWVNANDYWNIYYDIMFKIKGEFDKNGLSMPYPQLDVHMAEKHN